VDVKHKADGWSLVGCIVIVDAFDAEKRRCAFFAEVSFSVARAY